MTKFSEYQASLSSDPFFCFGCYKKTATTAPLYDFFDFGAWRGPVRLCWTYMFLVTLGRAWEGVFGLGDTNGFFNVRGDLSHKFYTRPLWLAF